MSGVTDLSARKGVHIQSAACRVSLKIEDLRSTQMHTNLEINLNSSSKKRHLLLCTAGHVDHGKTALIQALTGVDADRLPEEKRRGLTIDLGFASLELENSLLGIVDVPGHERYVKNMLAGATGVNVAMLVVAADESVMPQTREHFEALRHLRISAGVVAVTKCDLVEEEMVELVEDDIKQLVAGSFLQDATIVRVSAKTGDGIDKLRSQLSDIAEVVPPRSPDQPFRLAVDRCFSAVGHGTVVTGSVVSGRASLGDKLQMLPQDVGVTVRRIESHNADLDSVGAGQRAALNLTGVSYSDVKRGDLLVTPNSIESGRRLTVRFEPSNLRSRPLKSRQGVRVYLGASELLGQLRLLEAESSADGQQIGQVELDQPVFANWGDPFVLRGLAENEILGGGQIIDPLAARLSAKEPLLIEILKQASRGDELQRVTALVTAIGTRPWTPEQLYQRAGVSDGLTIVQQLVEQGVLVRFDTKGLPRWLHRDAVAALDRRLLESLDQEHQSDSMLPRMPLGRLKKYFDKLQPADLLTLLAQRLGDADQVNFDGESIAATNWQPKLSARQAEIFEQIVEASRKADLTPPSVSELADAHDLTIPQTEQLLELGASSNVLVRLPDKDSRDAKAALRARLYIHADNLRILLSTLETKLAKYAEWTVSQFSEELGLSRKYAIPLCEYLDRCQVTSRQGDVRKLNHSSLTMQ